MLVGFWGDYRWPKARTSGMRRVTSTEAGGGKSYRGAVEWVGACPDKSQKKKRLCDQKCILCIIIIISLLFLLIPNLIICEKMTKLVNPNIATPRMNLGSDVVQNQPESPTHYAFFGYHKKCTKNVFDALKFANPKPPLQTIPLPTHKGPHLYGRFLPEFGQFWT